MSIKQRTAYFYKANVYSVHEKAPLTGGTCFIGHAEIRFLQGTHKKESVLQGAAEIVQHFKILFTCWSARLPRSAGI